MATATRKKGKKIVKTIVVIVVLLAVVGGIVFGLWKLFHKEEKKEVLTQELYRGSIVSQIYGYGTTKALTSVEVKMPAAGKLAELYVTEGDNVMEGDPLFLLDAAAVQNAVAEAERAVENQRTVLEDAQKAVVNAREGVTHAQDGVEDAQKAVTNAERALQQQLEQLETLRGGYGDLTTSAPFAGKLLECQNIHVGDTVGAGTSVAKLVDDKQLRLELYFSYAYEGKIRVGQAATVSIPALMATVSGTVAEVNMISRISPEGARLFQVVFNVPNAGALAAEMAASVSLAIDGEEAYPYESGTLAYAREVDLTMRAGGKVTAVNLMNYLDVQAGAALVSVSAEQLEEQIEEQEARCEDARDAVTDAEEGVPRAERAVAEAERAVTAAEEAVTEAEQKLAELEEKVTQAEAQLEDLVIYAPISGQVLSASHNLESVVEANTVIATVADTSVMVVEARVDEMNIMSVQPGMMVDITQDTYMGTNFFMGVVESVALLGNSENGVSYFPVTIRVESYDPSVALLSGMNVQYNMIISQSDGCLLAPIQAVQYTEAGACLFVKADAAPANAVDPGEGVELPKGFWAVPVTTGMSDSTNVEILDGVEEGTTVFIQYLTDTADSWGWGVG